MKAKFLKLAGVKNEKEFYEKFPTEEAFMAKYGKQLKKAYPGVQMPASLPTTAIKPMPVNIQMPQIQSNFSSVPDISFGDKLKIGAQKFANNPNVQNAAASASSVTGNIAAGMAQIKSEKRQQKEREKYVKVSKIAEQAATSNRTGPQQRKYVRPEDYLTTAINPMGVGTNYLAAENGAEIMNTYAPDVIYTDLGYEPLDDSNKVKAFKKGGKMKKADAGLALAIAQKAQAEIQGMGQIGSMAGSQLFGGEGETGGYSTALGQFGGLAGLGLIGGALDAGMIKKRKASQAELDQNLANVDFQKVIANQSYMKEGGWISHDWQPQVIASFGEHSMKQLLKPDPTMDTLRSGGHLKEDYVPVSDFGLNTGKAKYGAQMAMGGDLEVYRGEAETMSYNPYLPNDGETIMFRGPSHEDGGMPISYGENGVEVEGGEPAMVMKDGGKKDSLVVFGNMQIPEYGANEIGDPKAKGMKFKRYIADLSKQEAKQNKTMDKAVDLVNSSDATDPFEQLSLNSGKAMLMGTNMKLKDLANKKMTTAAVQNAILDTADEYGLESDKLAKMRFGGKLTDAPVAKDGALTKKGKAAIAGKKKTNLLQFLPNTANVAARDLADPNLLLNPDTGTSYVAPQTNTRPLAQEFDVLQETRSPISMKKGAVPPQQPSKRKLDWSNIIKSNLSAITPFARRTNIPLDPSELAPEMLAMALNQPVPVPAQQYTPMTVQPMQVSLQDQLNEITAQARAAEKMAIYNPTAAANLFAAASQAKNKVLADQFRLNQTAKQQAAQQTADVLNDARLKNLAILDQQMVRQFTGASKTKAEAIEIAKSIADKVAQNKLMNRQLQTIQAGMPAFRFTSEGMLYKDPLYLTDISNPIPTAAVAPSAPTKATPAKNGAIVKAFKNF